MRRLFPLGLIVAALLGGCARARHGGTIEASAIGATLDRAGAEHGTPPPAAALADATGAGLVRLDREGRVTAGAALRWAILDDGLDYIFRIDRAGGLSAAAVARRLRQAVRDHVLPARIASIRAVTASVVEIRLAAAQPDLLVLLARPEFGVGARGAMRLAGRGATEALLEPWHGEAHPMPAVRLRAEPAGRAVARFLTGGSALVLGGTFADLAVARAGVPPRGALRFDPVTGLFGLVVRDARGPLADPTLRHALSLALDRDTLVAAIDAPGLAKATTPAGSAAEPPLAARRGIATAMLAGRAPPPRPVSVAMPAGPGARLLFALVARDWRHIGVVARSVPAGAPADLALVDLVAPPASRAALACAAAAACGDPADPPYIPIAAPVRWSLVARSLDRFAENALAAHPLDQLRAAR